MRRHKTGLSLKLGVIFMLNDSSVSVKWLNKQKVAPTSENVQAQALNWKWVKKKEKEI